MAERRRQEATMSVERFANTINSNGLGYSNGVVADDNGDYVRYSDYAALKAELEGARAQLAERGGVAVKALEWAEDRDDDGTEIHRTRGGEVNLTYTIYEDGFIKKPFSVSLNQLRIGSFDTVAEAKAAAQADYERRILSALAPSERRQVTEAMVVAACRAADDEGYYVSIEAMRTALEATLQAGEAATAGGDAGVREALREFAESFHITVSDNFYKDVTLHLDHPHSLVLRLRNDSTKSWLFQDLEDRRRAAIRAGETAADGGDAAAYAERLAIALHEKHYAHVPQWKPLSGDLLGLLTQIDNMTSSLSRSGAGGKDNAWEVERLIAMITPSNFHYHRDLGDVHGWCDRVRDGLAKALRQQPALSPAVADVREGWRPIETADKDAGQLLLGVERKGRIEEVHLGGFRYAYNDDEASCWWSDQADDEIWPTHWSPVLPAAPEPKGSE